MSNNHADEDEAMEIIQEPSIKLEIMDSKVEPEEHMEIDGGVKRIKREIYSPDYGDHILPPSSRNLDVLFPIKDELTLQRMSKSPEVGHPLPQDMAMKEISTAGQCFIHVLSKAGTFKEEKYLENKTIFVKLSVLNAYTSVSGSKMAPPKPSFATKEFKPRRWVQRYHTRHDGMKHCVWERESEDFVNNAGMIERNPEIQELLTMTEEEYNLFLSRSDVEQGQDRDDLGTRRWPHEISYSKRVWTWDESKYLLEMYRKYSARWVVLADRYNYKGLRRNAYEIKSRFYHIFNMMCFIRDKRHLVTGYDPDVEYATRKRQEHDLAIKPEIFYHLNKLDKTIMEISPSEIEPQPPAPTVPEVQPAPVQKSLTTARSSSSVPPSRLSSIPKLSTRANLEHVTYDKRIEAAMDTSVLRFFNATSLGPHFRSQEYKLMSNVNPKKRANIDSVVEAFGLLKKPLYTEKIAKCYMKISANINIISELKAVYNAAVTECKNLYNEVCEKSDVKMMLQIPPLPKADPNSDKPSICSLAEAPTQAAQNRKRI